MFFARSNVCPRTGLPISAEMVPSIVAEDGIAFNPKNTFEQQPHSTAFY